MSEGSKLGIVGAMSIAVGGMIGGGVYSVLGVVILQGGAASWMAFTVACLISMGAAYSYIKLNKISGKKGGSVTQIEAFTGRSTLAGMVGWTLLFGYLGAVGMYAFAFGGFSVELLERNGIITSETIVGLPIQTLLSVSIIVAVVVTVVAGTQITGVVEVMLSGTKVAIIAGFGIWGYLYGFGVGGFEPVAPIEFGFEELQAPGSIFIAAGISFVSFQGWQLLIYSQEDIINPERNVPIAIYASIILTIILNGTIAILVFTYASIDQILADPEVAVAFAAETFIGPWGFLIIALSALVSTASAIIATLYSSAHFAKGMIRSGLLPDRAGSTSVTGAPPRTVIVLGALSVVMVAIGRLEGVVSFGSLMFMIVFGSMSYLALTQRHHEDVNIIPPLVGFVGSFASVPILLRHLYLNEPTEFVMVVLTAAFALSVELLYFGRETIWDGVKQGQGRIGDVLTSESTKQETES